MEKEEMIEILVKSQEKISNSADSKLQDQSISWKKVVNEKQLKFNDSLEAKFDSAIAAIDKKKFDKIIWLSVID